MFPGSGLQNSTATLVPLRLPFRIWRSEPQHPDQLFADRRVSLSSNRNQSSGSWRTKVVNRIVPTMPIVLSHTTSRRKESRPGGTTYCTQQIIIRFATVLFSGKWGTRP